VTVDPNAARIAWEAASPEQREVWRKRMTARRADKAAHPLAYARLWHSERTSQREAMRNLGEDATLVVGGNGAGKTMLGGQVAAAFVLGRDHPDAAAWLDANGVDASFFPPRGDNVIASSLNSALSIDVQRAMVAKFLPPVEVRWRNQHAPGVASVTVLATGKKIIFLTNDAKARAFQGYAAGLVWLDEEHDEPVYNECLQRISRSRWDGRSGWILGTMTPLKGMTWVHRRFVETPDEGTRWHALHGGDNPHIDQEKRERLLKGYGVHEREARDKGVFVVLEGRVFIEWDRSIHVVESTPIPDGWLRFAGWDFGTRNPTAIPLLAHDPSDDTIHVYREHYQADKALAWHADKFKAMTGGTRQEFICADSADKGARIQLAQTYSISTVPSPKGPNSIRDGINRIAARLTPDANGRPHFVVHDCCAHLIKEIESYRWDPTQKKGDLADAPLKKDDHAIDAVRYAVTYFERSGYV
jgi:phage terminase large subunit